MGSKRGAESIPRSSCPPTSPTTPTTCGEIDDFTARVGPGAVFNVERDHRPSGEEDDARDVDRTKRRDAEFAEKNAEKNEGLIEKKLSVRLCDHRDFAVR